MSSNSKQWTINLLVSGSSKIIEISEASKGDSLKKNVGTLMIYHIPHFDPDKLTLDIRGVGNSDIFIMNIKDIVSPAIGLDSYELYLDKMARYLNGDVTAF
jgi:hypothetical protein